MQLATLGDGETIASENDFPRSTKVARVRTVCAIAVSTTLACSVASRAARADETPPPSTNLTVCDFAQGPADTLAKHPNSPIQLLRNLKVVWTSNLLLTSTLYSSACVSETLSAKNLHWGELVELTDINGWARRFSVSLDLDGKYSVIADGYIRVQRNSKHVSENNSGGLLMNGKISAAHLNIPLQTMGLVWGDVMNTFGDDASETNTIVYEGFPPPGSKSSWQSKAMRYTRKDQDPLKTPPLELSSSVIEVNKVSVTRDPQGFVVDKLDRTDPVKDIVLYEVRH
jgi:hypothetical protein